MLPPRQEFPGRGVVRFSWAFWPWGWRVSHLRLSCRVRLNLPHTMEGEGRMNMTHMAPTPEAGTAHETGVMRTTMAGGLHRSGNTVAIAGRTGHTGAGTSPRRGIALPTTGADHRGPVDCKRSVQPYRPVSGCALHRRARCCRCCARACFADKTPGAGRVAIASDWPVWWLVNTRIVHDASRWLLSVADGIFRAFRKRAIRGMISVCTASPCG